MTPIPFLDGAFPVRPTLTAFAALMPALLAWWSDRRALQQRDDPALPELLASRRRANVQTIAFAIVIMIMFGGASSAWGIPLLIVSMIAVAYPLRTRLLGETWGFGAYLWYTAISVAGGFGFWIALAYAPSLVRRVMEGMGGERRWLAVMLATALAALLIAWEMWYPRIWLWAHAGEPLVSPELTPRFEEIIRRAGTVTPRVYRVGPKGSRFVNAVALPSVRQPSVALGTALLELLDADEATAIFAHEIAHFDHLTPRRVRRSQLINRALIGIGVSLPLLLPLVMPAAQVGSAEGWIGWLWPLLVLTALVRRAAKSQQHETESDLRAAALSSDPEALVRALVKLHLHARIPRRYAVDMERASTHPSLVRRIQAIRAGAPSATEQLDSATAMRSTRPGSWVVLDHARSYWLDGVPEGTAADLATLREAASSYRAVNYADLAELRVTAAGDARAIAARTRSGDAWTVPLAAEDVARVQRTLDIVDLKLGKVLPAPTRVAAKPVAIIAFLVSVLAGQTGIVLVPLFIVLWKPAPAAFAALGAMSIARAILGWLEGSGGFDEDIARLGLVAMAVLGAVAIYLASRLVKAGRGRDHLGLTLRVLGALAAAVALITAWEIVQMPEASIVGAPIFGTLGTALAGLAAALFTAQTPRSRQAAFAAIVATSAATAVGVDRSVWTHREALAESTARAALVSETDLGGAGQGLRVSPDGKHFLVLRAPSVRRAAARPAQVLLAGRVGGEVRELAAVAGDFVDDERMLLLDVLDSGVALRLERVDGGGPPIWTDTIAELELLAPRLTLERDMGTWSVIGDDVDNDRTAVVMGKIGEHGAARRAGIPDTISMVGEPIVFGSASAVIVPTFANRLRATPISLWAMVSGIDAFHTDLFRVHGDTVRHVATLQGATQCGQPSGGAAACSVQRRSGTALYSVSVAGVATEVARLSSRDLGVVALGPGLRATSMTYKRDVVLVDLTTRRLTRIALPPNGQFASEVRVGPGWLMTLSYAENRRSAVRFYRVIGER